MLREALAKGEVTPELEKLLGESIGMGITRTGPGATEEIEEVRKQTGIGKRSSF